MSEFTDHLGFLYREPGDMRTKSELSSTKHLSAWQFNQNIMFGQACDLGTQISTQESPLDKS